MIDIHITEHGFYLPDHKVVGWVDAMIDQINKDSGNGVFGISQELILLAIRVRIKQGKIDHTKVLIHCDGKTITVDKDGRLSDYIQRNVSENLLMELL